MRLKKLRTCATIMSREFFHSTLPTPWQMVPEKSDINAHMGSCFAPFFSNILPPSDHYLTLNTSCRHLDLLLTRFIRRALKLFVLAPDYGSSWSNRHPQKFSVKLNDHFLRKLNASVSCLFTKMVYNQTFFVFHLILMKFCEIHANFSALN